MAVTACPAYTYTFRRGMPAQYHGPAGPSLAADAIADLSLENFDRLVAHLVGSRFFAMQPRYVGPLDSPTVTVTAWYGPDSTVVAADAGAAAPVGLTRLHALLDSAGSTLVWRSATTGRRCPVDSAVHAPCGGQRPAGFSLPRPAASATNSRTSPRPAGHEDTLGPRPAPALPSFDL